MIRYVIIEDEADQIDVLNLYIRRYHKQLYFAGSAKTIEEGIRLLEETKPDIVFLDIHLEDGSGFEIIEHIQNFNAALLVFTAFEDQALASFRHNAIDFLEKPINAKELNTAVDKALKFIQNRPSSDKFMLSLSEGKLFLEQDDIVLLRAQGATTFFYIRRQTKIEEYCSGYSLGKHEEKLSSPPFYRIHDKFLLNTKYLERIAADNRIILTIDVDIETKFGKPITVSQHRLKEFKEWLLIGK